MQLFFILFISSTVILTSFWSFILEQLCVTSIKNKQRLQRAVFAFLFCTTSMLMNTIYYLSSMYSHYVLFAHFQVADLRNICEGIGVVIGSQVYRIYLNTLYDALYSPMEIQKPIFIQYVPAIIQFAVLVAAITCYICDYIYSQPMYMFLFYIILDGIILIPLLIFVYIWSKILNFSKAINFIDIDDNQAQKVQKLMILVKGTMIVAVILGISDVAVIIIALDFILDFTPFSYNEELMSNIVYSLFIIMVNVPLLMWAYKKSKCCFIDKDSVCSLCGCDVCCYKKRHNPRLVTDNPNNSIVLPLSGQDRRDRRNTHQSNTSNRTNITNISNRTNRSGITPVTIRYQDPTLTTSYQIQTMDTGDFERINGK
eukprot:181048_1